MKMLPFQRFIGVTRAGNSRVPNAMVKGLLAQKSPCPSESILESVLKSGVFLAIIDVLGYRCANDFRNRPRFNTCDRFECFGLFRG
jgi:hypothetical protein